LKALNSIFWGALSKNGAVEQLKVYMPPLSAGLLYWNTWYGGSANGKAAAGGHTSKAH